MSELENLSTTALFDQAASGDETALDALYGRYVSRLRRWARGRVTPQGHPLLDTDGIVQRTLLRTLRDVSASPPEARRTFLGDVRRAIDVHIVRELEQREDIPSKTAPPEDHYESAFRRLSYVDQVALAARLEEGLSYGDIALELGQEGPEEARTAVTEAILRLAKEMRKSTKR